MTLRRSIRFSRILTLVAATATLPSCADAPTDSPIDAQAPTTPSAHRGAEQEAKKTLVYTATVRGGGTLVDGTALGAERISQGVYQVTFPPPILGCAATANAAAFPTFDVSILRVVAHVSIALPDVQTVTVRLFDMFDNNEVDSSFSVILACPRDRSDA